MTSRKQGCCSSFLKSCLFFFISLHLFIIFFFTKKSQYSHVGSPCEGYTFVFFSGNSVLFLVHLFFFSLLCRISFACNNTTAKGSHVCEQPLGITACVSCIFQNGFQLSRLMSTSKSLKLLTLGWKLFPLSMRQLRGLNSNNIKE